MERNDFKCKNMNMCQPRQARTHAEEEGNAGQVDRLVETLALASVRGSTQKVYWSKWQTWCRMSDRRQESLVGRKGWGRRRSETVDKFHGPAMICVQKPKSNDPWIFSRDQVFPQKVCGVGAVYVRLHGAAVEKGIDTVHQNSDVRPWVRMPLTWNMLTEGMDRVIEVGPEGSVIWRGLALSFHILCRASEIWVYGNGLGTLTCASLEETRFSLPELSNSRGKTG